MLRLLASAGTGVVEAIKEKPAQAGPLGLFVILLLGVATVLLIRSMSKHLRRLPASFDPPEDPAVDPAGDEGAEEHHSGG